MLCGAFRQMNSTILCRIVAAAGVMARVGAHCVRARASAECAASIISNISSQFIIDRHIQLEQVFNLQQLYVLY